MKFAMMIIESTNDDTAETMEIAEHECTLSEAYGHIKFERALSRDRVKCGFIQTWTELIFVNGEMIS